MYDISIYDISYILVRISEVVKMAEMDPQVCQLEHFKSLSVKSRVLVLKRDIPSAVAALGGVKCHPTCVIFETVGI